MKLSIKGRQSMWAYIFISAPMLFFLCIRIYPALYAFNVSLHKWDLLSKNKPFVFLDNFMDLFHDQVFKASLINTGKYILFAVPIGLALSLGIAMLLNSITKGASVYRMVVFIPYVTSIVAVSWVWRWMFMKQGGLINNVIGLFGISRQPFLDSTSQAIYVVISNIIWQALGFYTIIFLAGLKQVPKTYYEAAMIDGASPWQKFKNITIPLLNPTIVYLSVMATIQTLQVFTQVFNITSGGQGIAGGPLNSTVSVVLYIYQLAFVNYKMGYASAATVVLFIIILTISLFQMKVLDKKYDN
ncbi:carbohydrate ABC transporter permease [Ruminiclostridium cellobioparum]|jgi:multiple sugar transport system permease protein|uniref:Sugar ABC transporter permease n=1 Tax=Ruminiclostridium cellobioparum subsp. termitidis CT1112 TaxID=1195236 RepID=S0FKT6_RUMCE|nr:sugar ABC transporter permease [Ruminiclostridium cellobioparum]EMS72487.1 sugar ABC transporter permease [Ruminiclostridium cellobioparum subsp. termitidis CT1112]